MGRSVENSRAGSAKENGPPMVIENVVGDARPSGLTRVNTVEIEDVNANQFLAFVVENQTAF
jgi:hypothetical protein